MNYLPTLADQTRLFLHCLGFGFALGILYDVFRVVRLLLGGKRRGYFIAQDLLYCLCCTGLTFFFFLVIGDGALHFYCLAGEVLGWLLYYVSLGPVALRASEWTVALLRRLGRFLGHMIAAPFLWLLRLLEKTAVPLRKMRVSTKKFKKNLHFSLQSSHQMVYNGERKRIPKKKENKRLAKHQQPHRTDP